jgi:hypothetical protein
MSSLINQFFSRVMFAMSQQSFLHLPFKTRISMENAQNENLLHEGWQTKIKNSIMENHLTEVKRLR